MSRGIICVNLLFFSSYTLKYSDQFLYQIFIYRIVEYLVRRAPIRCSLFKKKSTLLKKKLWYRCFSVNFENFLRTPFTEYLLANSSLEICGGELVSVIYNTRKSGIGKMELLQHSSARRSIK